MYQKILSKLILLYDKILTHRRIFLKVYTKTEYNLTYKKMNLRCHVSKTYRISDFYKLEKCNY